MSLVGYEIVITYLFGDGGNAATFRSANKIANIRQFFLKRNEYKINNLGKLDAGKFVKTNKTASAASRIHS